MTRFLDTTGTGRWITGPRTASNVVRNYGSAVMYEPGKIALFGGGIDPVNSVETVDLNQASPVYKLQTSMAYARRQLNATVLPDGTVLTPKLWNPQLGTWRKLAPMKIERIYHSTALLLLDGRVLSGGGGEGGGGTVEKNVEIFSPPYLFDADGKPAPRPAIDAAPAEVTYNQMFDVTTAQAADVAQVTLIRLPTATHGTNFNQRFSRLLFTPGVGKVTASAPAKATLAPPGHYMLFIVDSKGVPSVGKVVLIR